MSSDALKITVVTPDGPVTFPGSGDSEENITISDYPASSVVLPIHDGYLGVNRLHTPMIGKLGYGILEIDGTTKRSIYIDGGVVQIKDDHISVLASLAKTTHQLKKAELEKELADMGESKNLEMQVQKTKLQAQIALFN